MHSHPLQTSGRESAVPPVPRGGLVGSAIALFVYFTALHVLIVRDIAPWLSIALITGPWFVALAATVPSAPAAARRGRALWVVTAFVASGVLAWVYSDRLVARVDALLYAENLVFLLALCGLFAVTLAGDREPLVTRLARIARAGPLPAQAAGYTRRLTLVWALFFATMAAVSTLLFATQSRLVWSTFVNLLIWPSMAALFAVEYAVRLHVLRDMPHVPMMAGIDAFRQRHVVEAAKPLATAGVNE